MYKWIVDVCLESGYSLNAAKDIAFCCSGLVVIGVLYLILKIKEWIQK